MVFNEANQLILVGQVSQQVKPDAFDAVMLQPVIQAFVVAVVKALLLEFPFQVPVGFGDEENAWLPLFDLLNQLRPVFRSGLTPARSPQVRSKMGFIRSMAMSQRMPSH